jgi:hypothetical protein
MAGISLKSYRTTRTGLKGSFVSGDAKLRRLFKEMPDAAKIEISGAVAQGAHEIVDDAKRRVPVKTGNLKNKIAFKLRGTAAIIGVFKGTGADYAYAIEFGLGAKSLSAANNGTSYFNHVFQSGTKQQRTALAYRNKDGDVRASRSRSRGRNAGPQPYLLPAVEARRKSILDRIEKSIDVAIRKTIDD